MTQPTKAVRTIASGGGGINPGRSARVLPGAMAVRVGGGGGGGGQSGAVPNGVVNSASYAALPGQQTSKMDRIQALSLAVLTPTDRKLDWVEAVAFAIDAFDNGQRARPVDARQALREHGALWMRLHTQAVAVKVYEHLAAQA